MSTYSLNSRIISVKQLTVLHRISWVHIPDGRSEHINYAASRMKNLGRTRARSHRSPKGPPRSVHWCSQKPLRPTPRRRHSEPRRDSFHTSARCVTRGILSGFIMFGALAVLREVACPKPDGPCVAGSVASAGSAISAQRISEGSCN